MYTGQEDHVKLLQEHKSKLLAMCVCLHVPGSYDGIYRGPWQHRNSSSSLEQTVGIQSAKTDKETDRQKQTKDSYADLELNYPTSTDVTLIHHLAE